jgi:hypothetical protein
MSLFVSKKLPFIRNRDEGELSKYFDFANMKPRKMEKFSPLRMPTIHQLGGIREQVWVCLWRGGWRNEMEESFKQKVQEKEPEANLPSSFRLNRINPSGKGISIPTHFVIENDALILEKIRAVEPDVFQKSQPQANGWRSRGRS